MISRLSKISLPILLFAFAQLLMGTYHGFYDPSFNNYLSQVHHLDALARGSLEFTRELPGFLLVFIFALLAFLPDTRVNAIAMLLIGISLLGQGHFAPEMKWVILWMLLWSAGEHLNLVLKSSIALRLVDSKKAGSMMGTLGGLESFGLLIGMIIVYFGVASFNASFTTIFTIAGVFAILASIMLFTIKPEPLKTSKYNFLFKKKYALFYFLNILFGARKQVFLTFAPWILIKLFSSGVSTFAVLGIIGAIAGLFFRPLLGIAIDRWGEKRVIFLESFLLIIVCIVYGGAPKWLPSQIALLIIMTCYIADQMLIAVSIARSTYLSKIADDPADIAPSISMGITLDHAVSMTIPIGGGLVWVYWGYEWVFWLAAVIAFLNLIASLFIIVNPDK